MKMNTIDNYTKELFVGLGSEIDYSRWGSFSANRKYEELNKPDGLVYLKVENLKEASVLVTNYIKYFSLGSSNWTGGLVLDKNYNFVARVSYNGRVWDSENYQTAKEILC